VAFEVFVAEGFSPVAEEARDGSMRRKLVGVMEPVTEVPEELRAV